MKQYIVKHAKHLLTTILTAAMLLSSFSVGGLAVTVDRWGDSHEAYSERFYGDLNWDDQVDAADYMLLKRAVLGTYDVTHLTDVRRAADIDRNGKIDAIDYMILKRSILGTAAPMELIIEELRPNPYASLTDEELYAKIDKMLADDPDPEGANILAISFQRIKRETQGAAVLGSLGFSDDFEDPAYLDIGHMWNAYLYVYMEVPPEQLREAIFKLWRCDEISSCSIHGDQISFPD